MNGYVAFECSMCGYVSHVDVNVNSIENTTIADMENTTDTEITTTADTVLLPLKPAARTAILMRNIFLQREDVGNKPITDY